MSRHLGEDSSPHDKKRIDAFLDCIARLLAQRWLRDQRRQEEPPLDVKKRDGKEV